MKLCSRFLSRIIEVGPMKFEAPDFETLTEIYREPYTGTKIDPTMESTPTIAEACWRKYLPKNHRRRGYLEGKRLRKIDQIIRKYEAKYFAGFVEKTSEIGEMKVFRFPVEDFNFSRRLMTG